MEILLPGTTRGHQLARHVRCQSSGVSDGGAKADGTRSRLSQSYQAAGTEGSKTAGLSNLY